MLSLDQREAIDALVVEREATLGEVSRALFNDGLVLSAVFDDRPELRFDVDRIAREGNVTTSSAIATLLELAVRRVR